MICHLYLSHSNWRRFDIEVIEVYMPKYRVPNIPHDVMGQHSSVTVSYSYVERWYKIDIGKRFSKSWRLFVPCLLYNLFYCCLFVDLLIFYVCMWFLVSLHLLHSAICILACVQSSGNKHNWNKRFDSVRTGIQKALPTCMIPFLAWDISQQTPTHAATCVSAFVCSVCVYVKTMPLLLWFLNVSIYYVHGKFTFPFIFSHLSNMYAIFLINVLHICV